MLGDRWLFAVSPVPRPREPYQRHSFQNPEVGRDRWARRPVLVLGDRWLFAVSPVLRPREPYPRHRIPSPEVGRAVPSPPFLSQLPNGKAGRRAVPSGLSCRGPRLGVNKNRRLAEQLGGAMEIEFLADVGAVRFHRFGAHVQVGSDLVPVPAGP